MNTSCSWKTMNSRKGYYFLIVIIEESNEVYLFPNNFIHFLSAFFKLIKYFFQYIVQFE